jgi:hypothetical protein
VRYKLKMFFFLKNGFLQTFNCRENSSWQRWSRSTVIEALKFGATTECRCLNQGNSCW